jgi:hypothetical protein
MWFTLADDGKYLEQAVVDDETGRPVVFLRAASDDPAIRGLARQPDEEEEEEDDDWYLEGLLAREREGGSMGMLELRRYDRDLVYSNGHIHCTEGVVGTAGGTPIGLYPNPPCPGCGILMFHVATVEHHVRSYGDGFRSLFICESCRSVCCNASSWN